MKLFESLPRQSTVDQLKKIRKLIKKNNGDIGDKVNKDINKSNLNNMFKWSNPLDHHIDSYETFIKNDSKKSLGYIKESTNDNIKIIGYFIAHRYRGFITRKSYVKDFMKSEHPIIHSNFQDAMDERKNNFYDDSHVVFCALLSNGDIEFSGDYKKIKNLKNN